MTRAILPLAIALLLAASPYTGRAGAGVAQGAVLQRVENRLKQMLTELSAQRHKLRLVRRTEQRLLGDLEGIDRTKEQAERTLRDLRVDARQTRRRAQIVTVQLQQTEEHLAGRRQALGGRLRDIYKYGRTGYADVLLGADDFVAFATRWHLISTIVHADTAAIDAHAAAVARYRRLQAALARDQAYLRTLTIQTEARQHEITATEHAKREMLERIQVERAAYERVVRELEKNSKDLEAMIQKEQVAPRRPAAAAAHAAFSFLWPARGIFTSGFGMRHHPLFGIWHLHTGVDIAATWGIPVLAAAEGRVLYAGWFGGYGKIVVIDHGGGISTLYGHLSSLLVVAGDEVRRGQPVGRVGSTGYSTGPHLHFEVRVNGRPVDPVRL